MLFCLVLQMKTLKVPGAKAMQSQELGERHGK